MVKYFNMLENRKEFFLALINNQKREEIYSFNCNIPISYIKKYSNLFEKTEFLIDIYKILISINGLIKMYILTTKKFVLY